MQCKMCGNRNGLQSELMNRKNILHLLNNGENFNEKPKTCLFSLEFLLHFTNVI